LFHCISAFPHGTFPIALIIKISQIDTIPIQLLLDDQYFDFSLNRKNINIQQLQFIKLELENIKK